MTLKVYGECKIEPQLDVFVPVHGKFNETLHLTTSCIHALYAHTRTPFHLIVADDTKPDEDLAPTYLQLLCMQKDNITYIHSDEPWKNGNQFFNVGLRYCKTDYFTTVMNSVKVQYDWELMALQIMRQSPEIGVIGMKCLFPWHTIESAGIEMVGFTPVDVGRDYPAYRCSHNYEVQAVQWAFAMIRKSAAVGNLDEDIFNGHVGWDDIDNCFTIRKKGWKILYCGAGTGVHMPRATRGDNSLEAHYKNMQNAEAFYKRNGFWDLYVKSPKRQEFLEVKQRALAEQKRLVAK